MPSGLEEFDSVTICKYRLNGEHKFHVMDKFTDPNEVDRLERMLAWSFNMTQDFEDYEQLWIKTCPIFPTR